MKLKQNKNKHYEIRTEGNPNHWVYEYTQNGARVVGCFNSYDEAEGYVRMMKYKDKFMAEVKSGKIKEEEIPF